MLDEISRGDVVAAQSRLEAVKGFIPLEITSDVIGLAQEYYAALELPDKARLDSIHLALAVQHGMDYLDSVVESINGYRDISIGQKNLLPLE